MFVVACIVDVFVAWTFLIPDVSLAGRAYGKSCRDSRVRSHRRLAGRGYQAKRCEAARRQFDSNTFQTLQDRKCPVEHTHPAETAPQS
jgi:hypothetical protein